jgi:hypothetical protein
MGEPAAGYRNVKTQTDVSANDQVPTIATVRLATAPYQPSGLA